MTAADRAALRAQLERHEGRVLRVYRCTAGYLTIGCGRNLEGKGITDTEADYLLDNDIVDVDAALRARLPWYAGLDAIRQRVLIDMGFMGVAKLMKFRKMLGALKAGDYETAAAEMLNSKWARDVKESRSGRLAHMMRTGTEAA